MKNVKFNLNINLTTSKLAAYIILIIGATFSFIYVDGSVLLATFSATSAILMLKTYVVGRTTNKRRNYDNYNNEYECYDYQEGTNYEKQPKNPDEIG